MAHPQAAKLLAEPGMGARPPSGAAAIAPALLYTALVFQGIREVLPIVNCPSLPAVASLLGSPASATIGWVHFLAFDLFVGRWVCLDSRDREISPWLMASGPIRRQLSGLFCT